MLLLTLKQIPHASLHGYLLTPDLDDNKWKINGTETNVLFCNSDVALTEELKTYLTYFLMGSGIKKHFSSYNSFSNIPIKEV